MKKAEEAAERAEELAERAESALQNLEEPLELNKNSEPEPPDLSFPVKESEESDAVDFQPQNEPDFSEPDFDYYSHPEDSFFMPSEENAISETFDQTVTEPVSDALKEAADFLPNIVKMLEDKDCAKEYRQELELFEKLRNLSNFLPPKQREEFLSSKTRLLMDYVIGKMSGKPGLVKTVENLLKSGILDTEVDYESLEREASALTGDELITKVIKDLKYLTEELTDKNLAKALQDSADDVLSRM